MTETPENRRPLKTRSKAWAGALAARLGRARISPDIISLFSVVFAVLGAALLMISGLEDQAGPRAACLVGAAVCIADDHARGLVRVWIVLEDRDEGEGILHRAGDERAIQARALAHSIRTVVACRRSAVCCRRSCRCS